MNKYQKALDDVIKEFEFNLRFDNNNGGWLKREIKNLKATKAELKRLEEENAKYKALEQELKLYKKAFEICYGAVDIDTPKGADYECIFAYDTFPLTSNQEEVAIVKKALELLNKE